MANRFLNNIRVNDSYTLPADDGSDGQAIITDGSGNLSFGAVAAASADNAEAIHLEVKNTSGATINKGTPVYITGNVGNTDKLEIAPADASDASKMPAVGLLETTLSNNAEGYVAQGGYLKGLATATIDGTSTSSNDTVYVKAGGGLTMTKPTGTNYIQNVAKVARVDASNGSLIVSSILRTNDVPTPLYIDHTNQRLGIGTTTPSEKLDVNGNIVANNLIVADSIIHGGDTDTNISFTNNQISTNVGGDKSLKFGDNSIWLEESDSDNLAVYIDGTSEGGRFNIFGNGADAVRLSGVGDNFINSGNLGIGTYSPSAKLHVDGTDTVLLITEDSEGEATLRLGDTQDDLSQSMALAYNTSSGDTTFVQNGTLERMRIDSSGNVGIGTTAPSVLLHVNSGVGYGVKSGYATAVIESNDAQLDITSSSAGTWGSAINFVEGNGTSNTNIWSIARTTSGGGNALRFNFGTTNQHDNDTKVTFGSSGNVGIGTTSPSSLLHLYSNAPVISGTSTNNSSGLRYNTVGTAGDTHRFQYNGTTQLNIKNSGNVGIGTTSPSEKLDVSGNANITGNITVGGNLIVNGTTTTLNTTTVEVEDNILQLNTTQGSPDTATAATSGISVYRGDGITQASLIFNDADDTWDLTNNLVVLGNISAANLSGTNTGDQTLASLGAAAAAHTHTWANINGETANSVNEWGGLRHQTNDGYIDFGPANSNHAHIYTDRPDFYFNKELKVNNERVFHQGYHPNADTLTTARTISLTGDVTGSVSFNGSSDVSINTTVANNSHDHNLIVENGTITFGQGSLQWTDINGTGGTGLAGSAPQNPFNDWHHHIIMNHANSAGYYVDIAASFHYDRLHFRRKAGSTPEDWQEIFHDGYHPNADKWTTARTLTLGGDLTGSVSVDGSANVTLNASVTNDSHTHDGRYYTETESDSRFVNVAGDTMTGNLNLGGNQVFDATQYRLRSGNGYGIRFWDSSSYSIYMSSTGAGRLDTTSDYNMYFKMSDGTNRGFVFMNSTTPVAQIDSTGKIYSEGGLDVDGTYILNGQKGLKVRSIDESNYYSLNDSSTAGDFYQQFPRSGGAGSVAKVDDPTAPAVGCFEITGSYNADVSTDFVKVDINAEYTFEMYVKYVSGSDDDQLIYMGWGMYDSNKSSFGNTQRYWGGSAIQVDANSNNSDWILIRGTISGVGSSTGQFISGTEYVKPVILTNYNTNTNVIRVCGIRLYKSSQNLTKLQLGRAGAGSGSVLNVNTEYPDARVTLENTGSDAVRARNNHGYIEFGAINSSHAHIQTDRSNFYFNTELRVDTGRISSYNEDLILATANANTPTDRVFIKRDNGNVGIGTASPAVSLDINATDAIALPTGTTAQRPSSPAAGMFRYNTDDNQFEGYTTEWGAIAGSGSGGGTTTVVVDTFSGDGTDTTFDITNTIADEDNVQIYIDGIYQSKSNYSTSGTTITFSTAPPSGTNNVEVTHFVQVNGDPSIEVDAFNGDGSTTSFTLTTAPVTKNNLQIYIDGVYQAKANYSVSGTSLTFTTAPSTGTNNIEVTHLKIS